MTLVLASGEVVTLDSKSSADELCAARVAIGMLGVIVEVELEAAAMPWVRNLRFDMDLPGFLARQSSLLTEYEHVWVHWILGQDHLCVQCLETSRDPKNGFAPYVFRDNAMWAQIEVLPQRARVPSQGSAAKGDSVYMSMQYGLPTSMLAVGIDRIKSSGFPSLHADREIEMKFLKKNSGSYLGPNADDDVVLFNLWWPVDRDCMFTIFEPFEKAMRELHARPHWGKLHIEPDTNYMKCAYPGWGKFEAVRKRFDPNGTFSIFRS